MSFKRENYGRCMVAVTETLLERPYRASRIEGSRRFSMEDNTAVRGAVTGEAVAFDGRLALAISNAVVRALASTTRLSRGS